MLLDQETELKPHSCSGGGCEALSGTSAPSWQLAHSDRPLHRSWAFGEAVQSGMFLCHQSWMILSYLTEWMSPPLCWVPPTMVSVASLTADPRCGGGEKLAYPGQLEPQEAAGHSCSTSWGSPPSSLGYRGSLKSLCSHLNLTQFSCVKSLRVAFSSIILQGWPGAPGPWARTAWSMVTSSLPLLDGSFT